MDKINLINQGLSDITELIYQSYALSGSSEHDFIIDVTNEKEVLESLNVILSVDNDLTENEDYFQDDTLELGYESEADRIVKEFIKENGVPNTVETYKIAFESISESITEQDYFGESEVSFVDVDENRLSVVFMIGGQED